MNWKLNIYFIGKPSIKVPVANMEAANRQVVDIGQNGFTVNLSPDKAKGFRYFPPSSIDYIDAVPEETSDKS